MEVAVRYWSEGTPTAAILGIPDDLMPGERRAAVAFCHGFSMVKEVWLLENARRLCAQGYVTLNFDYRYFGESGGEPRQRLIPREQVQDIRNAVTFLEGHASVDPKRIGLYGTSFGCGNVSYAAGVDERVRATVGVAGPGDLERVYRSVPGFDEFFDKVKRARARLVATGEVTFIGVARLMARDPETAALLEKTHKQFPNWRPEVTFESLFDITQFKPESVVDRIAPRAILWIHPERDTLVPLAEAQSLFAKAGQPKKLVVLEGTEHFQIYDGPVRDKVMEHALAFYREHLPARG